MNKRTTVDALKARVEFLRAVYVARKFGYDTLVLAVPIEWEVRWQAVQLALNALTTAKRQLVWEEEGRHV